MDRFAKLLLQSGQTSISNYLLKNYTKLGMNSDEIIMYLQIKRNIDMGNYLPDIEIIINATGFSKNKAYEILHELIQKKIMRIKTLKNKNGNSFDVYDFELMYDKLSQLNDVSDDINHKDKVAENTNKENNMTATERKNVFKQIESEFGRPLSPIELEEISAWIDKDKYDTKLISLALREAVLNQVYSLKYIDRILINWNKSNIRTPADVENMRNKRESHNKLNNKKSNNNDDFKIPIIKLDK
ncbi:DnaD domain-containing protein [Apilactobacillus timberlakei]|uniref:DnaD domain protein n=1 Tax=Apilactobacillus timberlakei TaxID=2008380 RepID=A0ABY2YTK9_9LACO|nr:DnaD domain protein [Apilactobacillus timberlakei]TPR13950.1 DnaD domain protein [Apilactobacillus timberlakei]TPR15265.1 DnaD domain protein [Apilactobacillus timberlakei]TPR17156.1 DnaD domain protein [Apilactobacillus timberlakei]TPR20168.1 DnaD domain protein [Apilactobacillus timberlakei]TPR21886.1 DnaD domain protein [Apilactobacillus timberlakei]